MPTCAPLTACGGNPNPSTSTTWRFTGGCLDDALFSQIVNALNLACSSSGTVVSNKNGRVGGTVAFTAATVTRTVAGYVSFDTKTPTCSAMCPFFNAQLSSFGLTGNCAVDSDGTSCDCTGLTFQLGANASDPWTVDGGELDIQTASMTRTYAFCVGAGATPTLTYQETTPAAGTFVPDPGILTMTQ
jgi:hypothetical protein